MDCPTWITNPDADALWKKINPSEKHLELAEILVTQYAAYREAQYALDKQGRYVAGNAGQKKLHPAVEDQRHAASEIRRIWSVLYPDKPQKKQTIAELLR